MFVALPLALITPVKSLLFVGKGALLHDNVFAAMNRIGNVTSVLILICLGSTLNRGYLPNTDITK